MLHFALVGENEDGRDVVLVGHFQDGAGELVVMADLIHAPTEHHGHLHGLVSIQKEIFLFSCFWIKFVLPRGLRLKKDKAT